MYRCSVGGAAAAEAGAPTFCPQDGQNAAPWGSGAEQRAHAAFSELPHFMQKRAPAIFGVPQEGQFMSANQCQDDTAASPFACR